jgi:hypothetical protein
LISSLVNYHYNNKGTLGKALGGASGGYLTGKKEIIDILRYFPNVFLDKKQDLICFPILLLLPLLELP